MKGAAPSYLAFCRRACSPFIYISLVYWPPREWLLFSVFTDHTDVFVHQLRKTGNQYSMRCTIVNVSQYLCQNDMPAYVDKVAWSRMWANDLHPCGSASQISKSSLSFNFNFISWCLRNQTVVGKMQIFITAAEFSSLWYARRLSQQIFLTCSIGKELVLLIILMVALFLFNDPSRSWQTDGDVRRKAPGPSNWSR